MMYNTQKHWVCGLRLSFGIINNQNTTFRKLDLFPSSSEGKETLNLLGPLETANFDLLK
jgi:hypothetical protein